VTRIIPILIVLGVTIYALIDCARTPQEEVRNLPKWAWLLLIIFFETIGGIAWLIAGRPKIIGSGTGIPKKPRIIPPDDDPDFLRSI